VSKIFPAGVGWQGASVVADSMGYTATEVPFFLMTGAGDFLGVFAGHVSFYAVKKMAIDKTIDMSETIQSGTWLASAAFCSGTAWQPLVNLFHDILGFGFAGTFTGVWMGCGAAFYAGLRLGRVVLPQICPTIEPPNYDNSCADTALSISIGGATAFFVGTDVSFVTSDVDQNWLRPIVGIEDGTGALAGMSIAGSSTALGFTASQMGQNLVVPAGKNWLD